MGKKIIYFDKMFCAEQYNLEINFQIQNTIIQNISTIFRENKKNETIYHSLIL